MPSNGSRESGQDREGGVVLIMDKDLIMEYSQLTADVEDINLKRAAAEARVADASQAVATQIGQIKGIGIEDLAALKAEIAKTEEELRRELAAATARLKEGGYT